MASQSSMKVNFSLLGNQKKRKIKTKTNDRKSEKSNIKDAFASDDEEDRERKSAEEEARKRKLEGPLVIPLIPHGKATIADSAKNDVTKNKETQIDEKNEKQLEDADAIAISALIKSAQDRNSNNKTNNQTSSDTNFSSSGTLTISQPKQSLNDLNEAETDSNRPQPLLMGSQYDPSESDTAKYHRDLNHRAEDLSTSSLAYVQTPISEFGAAMLRGMGWKGHSSNDTKSSQGIAGDEEVKPRHHRLGLGATPVLTEKEILDISNVAKSTKSNKKSGYSEREAILKRKIIDKKEKKKSTLQTVLQNGSIVSIHIFNPANDEAPFSPPSSHPTIKIEKKEKKKRAIMIKTMGVPGLDQVLIQYENEKAHVAVNKKQVMLETEEALRLKPFRKFRDPSPLPMKEYEKIPPKTESSDVRKEAVHTESAINTSKHSHKHSRSHSPNYEHHHSKDRSYRSDSNRESKHIRKHSGDREGYRESDRERNRDRERDRERSRDRERDSERRRKRNRERERNGRNHRKEYRRENCNRSRSRSFSRSRSRSIDSNDYESKRRKKYSNSRQDYDDYRNHRHENGFSRSDSFHRQKHDTDRYRDDKVTREKDRDRDRRKNKNRKKENGSDYVKHQKSQFLPNIRVRVITSKVLNGKHHYRNEKGIVLDVLPNAKVTLRMDSSRHILEQVPSRYLETVIPKLKKNQFKDESYDEINGRNDNVVCLLRGKFRGKKGKMLEKKKDETGTVQLWEDGNIITECLDDIAEWCGEKDD